MAAPKSLGLMRSILYYFNTKLQYVKALGCSGAGHGFPVAGVGLGFLLFDDEGSHQRGGYAEGRSYQIAVVEALDLGGGQLMGRGRSQ